MLQNSLNCQEEYDKNSISLYGNSSNDKGHIEMGTDEDLQAKNFMKSANDFEKNKSALSFKPSIL